MERNVLFFKEQTETGTIATGLSKREHLLWFLFLAFFYLFIFYTKFRFGNTAFDYLFRDIGVFFWSHHIFTDFDLIPNRDFTHPYGLLEFSIGHLWWKICGPDVHVGIHTILAAFIGICQIWIMCQIGQLLGWRRFSYLIFLSVVPHLIASSSVMPLAHMLEAIFILLSLRDILRNNWSMALLWAVLALFVKPAMAYFLGLILLVLIYYRYTSWKQICRTILPAVCVFTTLSLMFLWFYGDKAYFLSLYHPDNRLAYKTLGFGFWRSEGREFWYPVGKNLNYYLGSPVLIWLLAALGTLSYGVKIVCHWAKESKRAYRESKLAYQEIFVVISAFLVMVWIIFLFGNGFSWYYYFYISFLGASYVVVYSKSGKIWTWRIVLIVLVLLSHYSGLKYGYFQRANYHTFTYPGLYIFSQHQREFDQSISLLGSHKCMILNGSAGLLFPGRFIGPRYGFFIKGYSNPYLWVEFERTTKKADYLLLETVFEIPDQVKDFLAQHAQVVWAGQLLVLYRLLK